MMTSPTRQNYWNNADGVRCTAFVAAVLFAPLATTLTAVAADKLDRTVLPIHEPQYPTITV